MSKLESNPHLVKLFVGMLSQDISLFEKLKENLQSIFSPVDLESPMWEWGHTDYYAKEMGAGLKRKFVFFEKLINPEDIAEIKLKTIEMEKQYLYDENNPPLPPFDKGGQQQRGDFGKGGHRRVRDGMVATGNSQERGGFIGGRRINLDPGYLDSSKVVVVSTKNYSHRIYLGKGIYGEVTLTYSGRVYQILPYTYPDFRTEEYLELFKKARKMYKAEIKVYD